MTQQTWIGHTLGGRYVIEAKLGQGGMSTVYKATDPNLKRIVAIKMIHAHLSSDPEFVRRFEAEATVVAQLRHPNIVQVYDFNHDGDVYYIVFEFVPGESLQQQLKRFNDAQRQMEMGDVLKIGISIGEALTYAHKRNIIHRDVKPANVMLNVQDEAILTDFGIVKIVGGAHHTATGAVLGTARYMSPEQIKGHGVDVRSDIYSLGITLYEMVSGHPPFNADSAMTLMMMHVKDPVPDMHRIRPDVSLELAAVINKALAKEPEHRYQTMDQLVTDLHHIRAGKQPVGTMQTKSDAGMTISEADLTELLESETDMAEPVPEPLAWQPMATKPVPLSTGTLPATQSEKRWYRWLGIAAILIAIIVIFFVWQFMGDGNEESPIAVVDNTPGGTAIPEVISTEVIPLTPSPTDEPLPMDPAPTETPTPTNTHTPTPTLTSTPPPIPPGNSSLNDTWTRPADGMVMVFVPGGTFLMGSNENDPDANTYELPQHEVMLDSFWIDRTEVTSAQFAGFLNENGDQEEGGTIWLELDRPDGLIEEVDGVFQPKASFAEHPVQNVSWYGAAAYCQWAEGQLPTEAQWEYAAKGPEDRIYPWGNEFSCSIVNADDETELNSYVVPGGAGCDGFDRTAPVSSFSPDSDSWVGTTDMAGNVWEWVTDWFGGGYYENAPAQNPPGPDTGRLKVLRGGGWADKEKGIRVYRRHALEPGNHNPSIGFRCVVPSDN